MGYVFGDFVKVRKLIGSILILIGLMIGLVMVSTFLNQKVINPNWLFYLHDFRDRFTDSSRDGPFIRLFRYSVAEMLSLFRNRNQI